MRTMFEAAQSPPPICSIQQTQNMDKTVILRPAAYGKKPLTMQIIAHGITAPLPLAQVLLHCLKVLVLLKTVVPAMTKTLTWTSLLHPNVGGFRCNMATSIQNGQHQCQFCE